MTKTESRPSVGTWVPGYEIPVINERAVRAAAGVLFLFGMVAVGLTLHFSNPSYMTPFGAFFMFDMYIRLFMNENWAPSMVIGNFITRRQNPEWVGAEQKLYAWGLGFGMALTSCLIMGFLQMPYMIAVALCSLCISFLFVEAAFGICVGCYLQSIFSKKKPQYCPGGVCSNISHNH